MSTEKLITVFGGSGFLGRHVVRALARRGYRVRVAVRRPDLAGHVQPLGSVGQIQPLQANLRYRWSIDRAIEGSDAVINLVGILFKSGRQTFDAVHDQGAGLIAECCRDQNIERLVHVSAIGANAASPSAYGRSKAAGEEAVLAARDDAIIMRPSIIFGPEDDFFNLFASMARLSPVLPLIGGGETLFQPVYVGDVAEAVTCAVDGQLQTGEIYELGGPEVKSFRQCLELMLSVIGRKRILAPIPKPAAMLKAAFLELLPKPLLTIDQVRLLDIDNIVSEAAKTEGRTLQGMAISPQTLEAILPNYLVCYRKTGQFETINAS